MSYLHHLSTGGAVPSDVFPQRPYPLHEIDEIAEELAEARQEMFVDSNPERPFVVEDEPEDCEICGEPEDIMKDPLGQFISARTPDDVETVSAHGQCGEDAGLELA